MQQPTTPKTPRTLPYFGTITIVTGSKLLKSIIRKSNRRLRRSGIN
jgi:hypothetical protein